MTTFNQTFNKLVAATLEADDQQIKIESETEMNNKNDKIMDMDESAKGQDFFRIIKLSK